MESVIKKYYLSKSRSDGILLDYKELSAYEYELIKSFLKGLRNSQEIIELPVSS